MLDPAPHRHAKRVLAIGLDAPNHALLLNWLERGLLPNIQFLRARGLTGYLASEKRHSNEHAWIPVLTGRTRNRSNHWLDQWNAQQYRFAEASLFDWIDAPLFYDLGEAARVIAFDLAAPILENFNGIQVNGFAVELNESFPQSNPPGLIEELHLRFGPDPKLTNSRSIINGVSGRKGTTWTIPSCYQPGQMEAFSDTLAKSAARRGAACLQLMEQEPWNLFLTAFSELHSAGHVLWHLSQSHPLSILRQPGPDPLLMVYQAVDHAIGELVAAAGCETTVVLFTLDATVPDCLENARACFLPEFLFRWDRPGSAALAAGDPSRPPGEPRLDYSAHWKEEVWNLRTPVGEALLESPLEQDRRGDPLSWCPANWYAPLWSGMKAFALPSVADGYIRINVRNREAHGIVDPAAFNDVCNDLEQAVRTLVDARTSKPIVREIIRVRHDPFDSDPKLPPADLIVVFNEDNPLDVVDSSLIGRIGPVPYFRSSSHQSHGAVLENLMIVCSSGRKEALTLSRIGALEDIPATILNLLGLPIPNHFDGVALSGADRS